MRYILVVPITRQAMPHTSVYQYPAHRGGCAGVRREGLGRRQDCFPLTLDPGLWRLSGADGREDSINSCWRASPIVT